MRPATPADEPRLREIARTSKGHWGYDPERLASWAASLEYPPERRHFVAEVDGTPVAYASLWPPRGGVCLLDDLWVEPGHIGRGIGSELFAYALGRARELGATAVELHAEPNAVGFYERLGGEVVGAERGSWGRDLPVVRVGLG